MRKIVLVAIAFVLLISCKPATPPASSSASAASVKATATPVAKPDIADLLRKPPASGEPIEFDAYFSGATLIPRPGGGGFPPPPDQIACPYFYMGALTDRPFVADLTVLNSIGSNILPDDAPWLIAVTPNMLQPGVRQLPQLPYHARLRGHLGEAVLAHCEHADRIFVVEQVVQVYEDKPAVLSSFPRTPPDDYATWTRYHDANTGFSLFYPPDWQIEQVDDVTWNLRAPQWPDWPIVVRVHAGETHLDQYDSTAMPPLLQGISSFGVYQQGGGFGTQIDTQQLDGYEVGHDESLTERSVSVLFSSGGRTYELALRYPLGFDAPQPLLTTYSIIVERFRLDVRPGPSPTPPVKQSLGAGPFLSQDEALAYVRDNEGREVVLLEARLMSEVEARQTADACSTFESHPDGVWLLTVQGVFEDQTRTIRMYLDATTGEQLCGEEIILNVTPWPTMPPNATVTPVSPSSTSIRLSPTPAPPPPPAAAFPSLSLTPIARPVSDWTNRIAYRGDDSGLWLMKPDGSDRQLIHLPADLPGGSVYGEDTHFVWSTDGSRIAFVSRYDLLLADLANGITQLIYHSETLPRGGPEGILPAPAWSPDNRRLAFADDRILYVADLAAQRVYTIADDVWSKVGSWDSGNSFAWTADGRSVLYLSGGTEVNDLRGLAVVSLDAPLHSRLIVPDALDFALSPDGQQLVYHLQDGGGLWQVETRCVLLPRPPIDCPAAARSLVSPTDDPGFSHLRWSPDGRQLLALSPFGGLWLIDVASGKIQHLDPGGSVLYVTNPWSPDGRQLVLPLVTDGGMTNSPLIIYDLSTRKAAQLAGFDTFNSQREAAWGRAAHKD
jgi:WD40 repeat protein